MLKTNHKFLFSVVFIAYKKNEVYAVIEHLAWIRFNRISGTFEVKITLIQTGDPMLGMMKLDKTYTGPS